MNEVSRKTRLKKFVAKHGNEINYTVGFVLISATCAWLFLENSHLTKDNIRMDRQIKQGNRMVNDHIMAVRNGHEFKWDEAAQMLWDVTTNPEKK